MNNSIDARIAALALALERRKMEQAQPVDELSQSLREFHRELRSMSVEKLAELLDEDGQPILTPLEAERMMKLLTAE